MGCLELMGRGRIDPTADPATLSGHTFDMRGAEYGHEGDLCTFQVMLERHGLNNDAALVEMGRIIRDADVLEALSEVADPYAERLLEGVSFLSARVRLKLDAEFPRFTQHLLEIAYPHYLAPTPAMGFPLRGGPTNPRVTSPVRGGPRAPDPSPR